MRVKLTSCSLREKLRTSEQIVANQQPWELTMAISVVGTDKTEFQNPIEISMLKASVGAAVERALIEEGVIEDPTARPVTYPLTQL